MTAVLASIPTTPASPQGGLTKWTPWARPHSPCGDEVVGIRASGEGNIAVRFAAAAARLRRFRIDDAREALSGSARQRRAISTAFRLMLERKEPMSPRTMRPISSRPPRRRARRGPAQRLHCRGAR
jgi:hypothetical protein